MAAYPKIVAGRPTGDGDVIIQAKIDGSQCTVVLRDGTLHFYNKGSQIKGNKVFQNTVLSLSNKPHLFKQGYTYHGESVCHTQHNIAKYARTPNYFWIVYEIIRDDGYALNQQEMEQLLEGTGIEIVDLLYSGPCNQAVIEDIMARQPETVLGGGPDGFEGIVVKRLDITPFYRRKIVSPQFREERADADTGATGAASELENIAKIGQTYDVPARIRKGEQRLRERDCRIDDHQISQLELEQELDSDLIKEHGIAIKDRLFCLFFNRMIAGARAAYLGQPQPQPQPEEIPEYVGYQRAVELAGLAGLAGPAGPSASASTSTSKGIPEFIERTRQQFMGPDGELLRETLWTHYGSIILEASRRHLRKNQ
jgi:hypothetical protein